MVTNCFTSFLASTGDQLGPPSPTMEDQRRAQTVSNETWGNRENDVRRSCTSFVIYCGVNPIDDNGRRGGSMALNKFHSRFVRHGFGVVEDGRAQTGSAIDEENLHAPFANTH